MTTTTIDSETVYTASVPVSATSATIVRMLPSGSYYNEMNISLSSSYNYYTSDSNWSSLTTSYYDDENDDGNDDGDDDGDDDQESDLISVYFTDNYNWGKVYAYTWGGTENTDSWPGTEMTYVSTNEYNQSVYKIEIASDVAGLIFNNGNGTQTVDITSGIVDGQGYYLTSTSGKCSVDTYIYGE